MGLGRCFCGEVLDGGCWSRCLGFRAGIVHASRTTEKLSLVAWGIARTVLSRMIDQLGLGLERAPSTVLARGRMHMARNKILMLQLHTISHWWRTGVEGLHLLAVSINQSWKLALHVRLNSAPVEQEDDGAGPPRSPAPGAPREYQLAMLFHLLPHSHRSHALACVHRHHRQPPCVCVLRGGVRIRLIMEYKYAASTCAPVSTDDSYRYPPPVSFI